MKVMAYRVGEEPKVEDIDKSLEGMQAFVKGYIECVLLEKDFVLVCNEEGSFGEPFQDEYRMFGNFFIAKDDEDGDMVELTEEEIDYVKSNIQEMLSIVLRF